MEADSVGRDELSIICGIKLHVPSEEHNDAEDDEEQQGASEEGESLHLEENIDDPVSECDQTSNQIGPFILHNPYEVSSKRHCCHHRCNQIRKTEGEEIRECQQKRIE